MQINIINFFFDFVHFSRFAPPKTAKKHKISKISLFFVIELNILVICVSNCGRTAFHMKETARTGLLGEIKKIIRFTSPAVSLFRNSRNIFLFFIFSILFFLIQNINYLYSWWLSLGIVSQLWYSIFIFLNACVNSTYLYRNQKYLGTPTTGLAEMMLWTGIGKIKNKK